jgi:hypothetical protein
MERGVLMNRLCTVAAFLAGAAGLSCGAGVHDGRGEVFVTQTVDNDLGGTVVLREATLRVPSGAVDSPSASITLRRFDADTYTGDRSPEFEISLPSPFTFTQDPELDISVTPDVPGISDLVLAYWDSVAEQPAWVPTTSLPPVPCQSPDVCGQVQIQAFSDPDHKGDAGTRCSALRFGIVQRCGETSDCLSNQACSAGACQRCSGISNCNP